MDNRPAWVPRLESALLRGDAAYREAAEIIVAALAADQDLTQAKVAEFIGHKPPWVSSLLKWHRAGCPPEGVFGPEIAARRDKAQISTSKYSELEELGQLPLWGGKSDWVPGRAEATYMALALLAASRSLKNAARLDRDTLMKLRSPTDEREVFMLKKLARELRLSTAAGSTALNEVQAALKQREPAA